MGLIDGFETKPGTGWQAAIQAAPAVLAGVQAVQANRAYGERMTEIENFRRQDLENPFANMSNPYENLAVATKAAEIQMEQSDQALANTLDTLRSTGASAGGATALANAALKSKQGVAASIESQEAQNEKLRAQGEQAMEQAQVAQQARLQNIQISEGGRAQMAQAQGKTIEMQMTENREQDQINYVRGQLEAARQDQAKAQADATSATMGAIGGIGSMAGALFGGGD